MKLTDAAQACISQAHMQRMSAGLHENLCVEHIFFALLALARYLDPPFNKPEYIEEGKAVRAELASKVRSIESASWQLRLDAKDPDAGYVDAGPVIGRAAEIAEHTGGDLTAAILARAVMESPTSTIRVVCGLSNPEHAAGDEKYTDAKPARPAAPVRPAEPEKPEENSDHTLSQLGALLALMAALEDKEHQSLKQSVQQGRQKRQPNVKRHTKIGFVTWRGGPVAAFIQYFLFGILIPFIALFALDYFTGAVTNAPTPFVGFLVNAFIILALFNLARGVNLLIGIGSKAFGHTLDLISDCLLLCGLAGSAELAYGLTETPVWMRAIVCVGSLLILLIGAGMFQHLSDQGDVTKTKIMFQNVEGTPGMIIFRFLTKELVFPLLLVSVFWIFRIAIPVWLEKTFWVLGFLWVLNILTTMWNCISLRYKASTRLRGNGKFALFMASLHLFWGLPALTVYLHWVFDWFPMKTWVIVILGIWAFFTLILAALSTRSATGVL